MRILRGKSNLEVSSQGFAWFVVGLVLATFVGGAVRTMLSSQQVHQRIVSELHTRFPQHEFKIEQTEVLLSRGIWPGFGLRLRGVTFTQDTCNKLSFTLEVPQAVLPVHLLSLWKGKVRLGKVELSDGRLHLNYKPCPPEPQAPAAAQAEGALGATGGKKPALSASALNWHKAGEHLNAIELNRFTITYERNVTWKVFVRTMELDLRGDLFAQGVMEIQKSLPFGALTHLVDLEAQGDNHVLQWGIRSEYKEGTGALKGSLDLNNGTAMVQATARQLPVKDVLSELHQMGFLDQDIRLKSTWLSCSLKWQGPLAQPESAPVQAENCKLEGGYGRIALDNGEFWPSQPAVLKQPAKIEIQKLQIQPLLEALNRKVLPKVLARPGVWTGEVSYLNPTSWHLDGFLDGLEIVFSNRSVRGKQIIERVHTGIQREGAKIAVTADNIAVQHGEFAGKLQLELRDDGRSGQFNVAVDKLAFSPAIQNLLVGGTIGALKFSGSGRLEDGELGHWQGDFELGDIKGAGWSGEGILVKSQYTPGVFKLDGKAKRVSVTSDWRAYPQLKTVFPEAGAGVDWRDVTGKVDITDTGGSVHQLSALEGEKAQPWKLKGNWVRDGAFTATLSQGSGAKTQNYSLRGERGLLAVQGAGGVAR